MLTSCCLHHVFGCVDYRTWALDSIMSSIFCVKSQHQVDKSTVPHWATIESVYKACMGVVGTTTIPSKSQSDAPWPLLFFVLLQQPLSYSMSSNTSCSHGCVEYFVCDNDLPCIKHASLRSDDLRGQPGSLVFWAGSRGIFPPPFLTDPPRSAQKHSGFGFLFNLSPSAGQTLAQ
jgi:hypothetical protein